MSHTLDLRPGQAVVVSVDQRQVDVVLEMRPPGSEPLVVDLPTRQTTPERLCFVTKAQGRHEIVVRPAIVTEKDLKVIVEPRITEAIASDQACANAMDAITRGRQYESLGEPEKAYVGYLRASELAGDAGDPVLEASALLLGLETSRSRSSPTAFEDAVRHGQAALERVVGKGLAAFEVLLKQRIANVERIRGNLERAHGLFLESLELAQRADDFVGMARAHTEIGRIARIRADLAAAEDAYRQALALWQHEDRPADHALTFIRLAEVSTLRSDLVEARDLLDEAERILPPGEVVSRIQMLVQEGWIDFLEQRHAAAIAAYEEALGLIPAAKNSLSRAGLLDRIASAERGRGDLKRAESLYKEVLAIYRHAGGASVAHTAHSLGDLYLRQGRLNEARPLVEEAVEAFRILDDDNSLAHALTTLADLERASGNLSEARLRLDQATQRFEGRWRAAFRKGDLARPTAMIRDIDSKYVDLLMELAEVESNETFARQAFARSDRARDRNLLALIGTGLGRAAPSPAEAQARRRLHEAIEELETRRSELGETSQVDAELRQLQLELDAVERDIRARTLEQSPWQEPLDVARLQRELPVGTCILSYVLAAARSHLFLVCPDRFRTAALPPRESLEARAGALLTALSGSDQRGTDDQAAFALEAATRELLGPISEDLVDVRRLVVVAEGTLAHLPFAALPDPAEGDPGTPLLTRLDVTQGPSVSVLAALGRRASDRPERRGLERYNPIAVFADPVYTQLDQRLSAEPESHGSTSRAGSQRTWARLPATRDEAIAIRSLAPESASLRLDFEASRQAVLDGALGNAAIIHFASHSDLDEAVPTSSGLVLSRFDEHGRPRPSHLRIRDIRTLELEADLVVLSSCRSGWARPLRGDALTGLAQAFFVAGASRVLVSLWPIDDEATAVLIRSFYRHLLAENADPATALRRAQSEIRTLQEWRSPFYWAGFALLGGWR